MTDKQIIIDGVDVHWCEHYTGNIGYLTDKNWTCRAKIQGTKCEDWSNCYFKRWQRKEQECERLRFPMQDTNYAILAKEEFEEYKKLKVENDELKMKNRILETECNEMRDVCNEFEQYYELLIEGHNKLKQTLADIRDIATSHQFPVCEYDGFWILQGVKKIILQKISECEEQ